MIQREEKREKMGRMEKNCRRMDGLRGAVLFMVTILSGVTGAFADVRLPSVIGSRMVLQREIPVPVWGWAAPGEKVTVTFGAQTVTATAGADSAWKVTLAPMSAGGPFAMVVRGKNTLRLDDILVGEVWVCSGQSNMEMRLCHVKDAANEVAGALDRSMRLFQITNEVAAEPQKDCEGRWEACRPSTAYLFSAAAYFFGRELRRELDVPVGLIHASWGGTTAEAWTRPEALRAHPELRPILDHWAPAIRAKTPEMLAWHRRVREWEEDVHHVLYAGKPILPFPDGQPVEPVKVSFAPSEPGWSWNAMIAPLVPFAIRGAIWYQGESNAGRAEQYRTLFPAMIADWRTAWGQGDFPFLFVQLANFGKRHDQPVECAWAELREAQTMTLSLPNTAMACAIDIGEGADIHPRNKQDVGRRLALGALRTVYGRDIVHSGPVYASMEAAGGRIRLKFTSNGGGLAAKDGKSLTGFSIAGANRNFVWAKAELKGTEVVVWSDAVPAPVAVRYAWDDDPDCTLMNREGLPAVPFRTDDWPMVTAGAR